MTKSKRYSAARLLDHPHYQLLRARGRGIAACVRDVKHFDQFRADLSASVKLDKARSKAAKKGVATRRRNARAFA